MLGITQSLHKPNKIVRIYLFAANIPNYERASTKRNIQNLNKERSKDTVNFLCHNLNFISERLYFSILQIKLFISRRRKENENLLWKKNRNVDSFLPTWRFKAKR